jgi:hypothetical protein
MGSVQEIDALRADVSAMMNNAWREPGFCVPNQETYPHQWLWDSCFHALVWSALGSDRGVTELQSCLARQHPDGFVPHMIYWQQPELDRDFWGRSETSTITQPPMYGHAIAELVRAGWPIPAELFDKARRGLQQLFGRPRTPAGLIPVIHPWETGCDDSARWDTLVPDGPGDRVDRWRTVKSDLVAGIAAGRHDFVVGSVGFNGLVAWNALELASVSPDDSEELTVAATELSALVAARWVGDRWVDDGPASGDIRTLDSMAALLVDPRQEGFDALLDPAAFGAPYGPRGAHRDEPSYDPNIYWRGPAWPQLSYLMMVAAHRAGHRSLSAELASQLVAGARQSGLAEFWNPETGQGLGAMPQSWAGLGLVAADPKWSAADG